MGEIAEMMLEGAMCEECGEFIDDGEECGYPRLCAACQPQHESGLDADIFEIPRLLQRAAKVACPECGKLVKEIGLADHQRDVHGAPKP